MADRVELDISSPDSPQEPPDCSTEPIRVPGSVQQHGFFLLVDGDFDRVLVVSENAQRYLGLPAKLILGASLSSLLERELLGAIRLHSFGDKKNPEGMVSYLGTFRLRNDLFSVVTHCIGRDHALEFEVQDRLVGPEMMNAVITNFVSSLGRLASEEDLCEELTRQVSELTGFDRVLLYSFNDEGHGTVRCEVNNGRLPSYLDLRFPASDIPAQARELYVLNTVRIIPDAHYQPSPLIGLPGTEARGLDLSRATLRSVSPVHLEYMRNMGTISSMSVSILKEGRLWGLISGHHAEPKSVPYLVRSACDMLTRMGSTQLTAFHTAARLRQMVHFHSVQRTAFTEMAGAQNFLQGLIDQLGTLRGITDAAGVALVHDGQIASSGLLPPHPFVHDLIAWLGSQPDFEVFQSAHLSTEFPAADAVREQASGVLAIRISVVQPHYLLWFRPELVSTVRWAGEPSQKLDATLHLHPRASFNEWREVVRGRSEPWTSMEVDSAREFRFALTSISLRRAEEAIEEGEARFQKLTHSLPLKIFTVNDWGQLTYVNERWRSAGLDSNGRWYEHADLSVKDALRAAELWADAVQSGQAFETELCLQAHEGVPERPNLVRVVPFQRAGGERAGWIGVFIDLTESKQREMALRMTEKLALTGRMTSVIAHEINNPLEAITNLMYLLRMDLQENEAATQYITMAESELERISGITKQTLRWNRETAEAVEPFLAGSMVDDVLRLFVGKIRNRQINVVVEGPRETYFRGVLGQIRQVLANLVSNAVDAAPIGSQIVIRIEEMDNMHGLSVRDSGNGIPDGVRAQLFEPFFSTKGDLGNGLGLYISKEIMDRHHGRIDVDSAPGQGTTMTLWLPR